MLQFATGLDSGIPDMSDVGDATIVDLLRGFFVRARAAHDFKHKQPLRRSLDIKLCVTWGGGGGGGGGKVYLPAPQ